MSPTIVDAILAIKAGDRAAFLRARDEAVEAVNSGWQPGSNPCAIEGSDFQAASALDVITQLDDARIFKFPQDIRFVYTANLVGTTFGLANARHAAVIEAGWQSQKDCSRDAPLMIADKVDFTRQYLLKSWADGLVRRYGIAQFERRMTAAANALEFRGIHAVWPAPALLDYVNQPSAKPPGDPWIIAARP